MWENKGFGYESLNGANKSFAIKQEFDAINGADLILVPVEDMQDHLADSVRKQEDILSRHSYTRVSDEARLSR